MFNSSEFSKYLGLPKKWLQNRMCIFSLYVYHIGVPACLSFYVWITAHLCKCTHLHKWAVIHQLCFSASWIMSVCMQIVDVHRTAWKIPELQVIAKQQQQQKYSKPYVLM